MTTSKLSRRAFTCRAALFVLGCALQVSGAATLFKRKAISRIQDVEAGMVFTPPARSEQWQVLSVSRVTGDPNGYTRNLFCIPVLDFNTPIKPDTQEITDYNDWHSLDTERPMVVIFCSHSLESLKFQHPV